MEAHIIRFSVPEYNDKCDIYVTTMPTEEQHKSYDDYMTGYMQAEREQVEKRGLDVTSEEYLAEFFCELEMALQNMLIEEGFELIDWESITTVEPKEE